MLNKRIKREGNTAFISSHFIKPHFIAYFEMHQLLCHSCVVLNDDDNSFKFHLKYMYMYLSISLMKDCLKHTK